MTKAELVEKIHAKAGLPTKAKAEEALDAVVCGSFSLMTLPER